MQRHPTREVIVIGAGAAGLAAARRLSSAGLTPLVLEARDRIGGRIWTDHTCGPVELGAEFVHGERAVTWDLIGETNLTTQPWPKTEGVPSKIYRLALEGTLLPGDHPLNQRTTELCDQIEDYSGPDLTVDQLLRTLVTPGDPLDMFVRRHYGNMDAADPARLSALALTEERLINTAGWENFHIDQGYDALMNHLAEALDIWLEAPVCVIRWNRADQPSVSVTLAGGQTLTARQVIITVPLSLLQANDLRFEPELPDWKQTALQRIVMGNVTKLPLWFKRRFWPSFSFLRTDGAVAVWWPSGTDEFPVLMGYSGGPASHQLAELGELEAVAQGLRELAQLFGDEAYDAFVRGIMIDWSAEPYSRGAYSYSPVNMGDARAKLAAPVDATLFFAGEATSTDGHLATVHGAIESGRRAADELLAERT